MMHHAPIGPLAAVASRLLIVLASVLGVGADAASAASPPADMPHRVADDAAGGVQPHLVLGQPARFAEGQVPTDRVPVDDPARAIVHDPGGVVYEYRGLDPDARYTARLTFLSDHPSGPRFPRRVARIRVDDDVLADAIELPEDELLHRDVELRRESYADDGAVVLRIEKVEGHNAVVSRVELWSDQEAPPADVALPPVFATGMVLQRDRPIPVWGWARPGQEVVVEIAGRRVAAQTGAAGRWQARLPPMPAGGPHELTVTGERRITLHDVLIGDVWICSGQSNMEMPLTQDKHFVAEQPEIDTPGIRLFRIPALWSAGPAARMIGTWRRYETRHAAEFSAVGSTFGSELHRETGVPIGLVQAAIGGTPIENWTPGPVGHWYNGMLHPLLPFPIRGAIWYQGESNIESGANYRRQMEQLIGGWRREWGQGQFPFYFVQLAPFKHREDPTKLCVIWQAQLDSLQIPNTGMAVTTDIGEGDLHPPEKREVGRRLARWALAQTYGRATLVPSGPLPHHYEINGASVIVHFTHADGGLASRDGKPLDWFEVAGSDGRFVSAAAKIDGPSVVVSSPDVPEPVAVRLGWHQLAEPNLVNSAGLPASPFSLGDRPE